MKLNFIAGSQSYHNFRNGRRVKISPEALLTWMILKGVPWPVIEELKAQEGYDPEQLEVKLTINGVETDLQKIIQELTDAFNSRKTKKRGG